MKKDNSQVVNTVLILVGAIILIIELAGDQKNVYLLILGFVILMFALYRATNHWSITKDDYKNDPEDKPEDKNH
ncbi:MAG: hypothetical protein WBL21_08835 [Salinimicrobium sp.]